MERDIANPFIDRVASELTERFGPPARSIVKVDAWNVRPDLGMVLQVDQPKREQGAFIWLPYPPEGDAVPDIALEYPGEAGRHSNTYPSPGLARGEPALKLVVRTEAELASTIKYIDALKKSLPLPEVAKDKAETTEPLKIDPAKMPAVEKVAEKRTAIPRLVQREVWQRDGGRCVECGTREKLCFDHIVPFSRGGSNSVRNLQLLCESCNSSKGNRI